MSILQPLFRGATGDVSEDAPEAAAQAIVTQYQQRRASGELRVDDRLFDDLCHVLPKKSALEVFDRFRKRRARSDPKANFLLVVDIGIAIHDALHDAKNFGRQGGPFQ